MTGPELQRERDALLRLSAGAGWGPMRIGKLLAAFGSAAAALEASRSDVQALEGIGERLWQTLERARHADPEPTLRRAAEIGAGPVTWVERAYPALLRAIYDPPPLLWVRPVAVAESILADRLAIAVVGTRRATPYGRRMARAIGSDLASRGVVVVSGLALGIDAEGHRGALEAGGPTVAVMGCGVDRAYPASHHALAGRILDAGVMIGEYPIGTAPRPGHFPERNRIIAGMSRATVIVEAHEKGGALITARLALSENRDLFAVPGRADSPSSRGTLKLLADGALLVVDPSDIVEALDAFAPPSSAGPVLDADETAVLETLSAEPASLDDVIDGAGLPVPTVLATLLRLEMAGHVRQLPGRRFCRSGRAAA